MYCPVLSPTTWEEPFSLSWIRTRKTCPDLRLDSWIVLHKVYVFLTYWKALRLRNTIFYPVNLAGEFYNLAKIQSRTNWKPNIEMMPAASWHLTPSSKTILATPIILVDIWRRTGWWSGPGPHEDYKTLTQRGSNVLKVDCVVCCGVRRNLNPWWQRTLWTCTKPPWPLTFLLLVSIWRHRSPCSSILQSIGCGAVRCVVYCIEHLYIYNTYWQIYVKPLSRHAAWCSLDNMGQHGPDESADVAVVPFGAALKLL